MLGGRMTRTPGLTPTDPREEVCMLCPLWDRSAVPVSVGTTPERVRVETHSLHAALLVSHVQHPAAAALASRRSSAVSARRGSKSSLSSLLGDCSVVARRRVGESVHSGRVCVHDGRCDRLYEALAGTA